MKLGPLIWAMAATLTVFAAWLFAGWGGPAVTRVVDDVGSVVFSTFAFGCAAWAAWRTTRLRRRAWTLLAVGLFGWVVGDLIWAYQTLVVGTPLESPSIADAAYLLLPVGVLAAALGTAGARHLTGIRALLDATVITASLFLISWVLVLRDVFATSDQTRQALVVAVAYPITDVLVVAVCVLVMTTALPSHRIVLGTVTAGLTMVAITDSALVYFSARGQTADDALVVGWALGLLLVGASALQAARTPGVEIPADVERSRFGFWLPYVPLVIAATVGSIDLWRSSSATHVIVASGGVLILAAVARQLTVLVDNRTLLDVVAEQALQDPLTGLANRLLFTDRLNHAMQLRERDGREVAVLSLDLDDFKLVNDHLGHPSGDALLRAVGERLTGVVPRGDTLARFGGDEFAILIEGGPRPADEIAQRVIEVFDRPFFLDGEEVYIHPSVGLATAPPVEDEELTADELFQRADVAMYAGRQAGVGGVQVFTPDMRNVDRAELRTSQSAGGKRRRAPVAGIQLLGQLRRAIDDDELDLVYQPKISLSTGTTVGVEALVRWPHPEYGVLTPNQFLPLVRQNGLMGAVTELVLYRAVHDAATWYDSEHCDLPVAINLFAPSLDDLELPDHITVALEGAGLPPAALSVEITEHLLLANVRRAATVIQRLRDNGLRIAIDDFGTGYATMSYLRDLPIDELKLDRQFISPVLHSPRAAAIVRSVIDLAHALGVACVAEGVEDAATAERLREYGCDVAQGHYFARPMSADELRAHVQLGCSSAAIFPITS
ncbi:putative bifunctional diguanylate cyclase/phosphodiesterase [Mycolicibacterium sediminis]|nr:EAL domain-containing protein [Mycolicibacterium sediminis]